MNEAALAGWLCRAAGATRLEIAGRSLMAGGAIQQNWRLDVRVDGVPQHWVLRTDAAATLSHSRSRADEFALLRAAFAASVTVPEPLFLCADGSITGKPFFVMRRVDGIAAGHRVVRSETLGGGRAALVAALGREMARIHSIRPPRADLAFLAAPEAAPTARFVAEMRSHLDGGRTPRPVLEWGLRHLERIAQPTDTLVLCHNDFRTGNLMVSDAGITGILDWEFANWGDRHEDIGWLCAPCWRFGGPGEVGGIGDRAGFYAAYEAEAGVGIDPARVAWWELAAVIRWAVIAIAQVERHISGADPSLELALTGHIVPGLELLVLQLCGCHPSPQASSTRGEGEATHHSALEQPAGADLLDIARQTLASLLPALDGDARFQALMVGNAMAIAGREMSHGCHEAASAAAALGEHGAVCAAIRAGEYDDGARDHVRIAAALHALTVARCRVSAPKALD